jgi:hypothetical protein
VIGRRADGGDEAHVVRHLPQRTFEPRFVARRRDQRGDAASGLERSRLGDVHEREAVRGRQSGPLRMKRIGQRENSEIGHASGMRRKGESGRRPLPNIHRGWAVGQPHRMHSLVAG